MSVTATTVGANTTIKHEFIGANAKIKKAYSSAAKYLWNHGKGDRGTEKKPIVWADLTDQDKLDLVHAHLMQVIKDMAKTYLITSSKETGGIAGENDYNKNVDIYESI